MAGQEQAPNVQPQIHKSPASRRALPTPVGLTRAHWRMALPGLQMP